MDNVTKCLRSISDKELCYSEEGIRLINLAQEMIARERQVVLQEKNILIAGCYIDMVDDNTINAFATKYDNEYYIFVNRGIVDAHRSYLESLNWSFINNEEEKKEYIQLLLEYGFYFIVFHEYAHILCGHIDAELDSPDDLKAQEYEADIFSFDYLLKYIQYTKELDEYTKEFEKLFLAVYLLMERSQKKEYREWYNDKIIQNYYDEDRKNKRNHPLNAQRILYEMLNVVIVTDKVYLLPVKEKIIEKLIKIKGLNKNNITSLGNNYKIVEDSLKELKQTLDSIREKIPRMGNQINDQINNN